MQKTYPIRTRFAEDIMAEVKLPMRQTGKITVLIGGLPGKPVSEKVLDFFAEKGYVAVAPRFRGTWESGGTFLKHSPAEDVHLVIDDLNRRKSLTDLFTGERLPVKVRTVHLFGASFGGPAVILNASHPKVEKVIALAPVLDFRKEGESEPFAFFVRFTTEAFGEAYRTERKSDWRKLLQNDFYAPMAHAADLPGKKVFIIHARDDAVVPYAPLLEFQERSGAAAYLKPKGGHFGMRQFTQKFYWKKIEPFLRKR